MGFSYRLRQRIASGMDVAEIADKLASEMSQQLRVRAGTLADVAARAGRKLPRHLRAEAQVLIDAQTLAAHPKLSHRVDQKRLKKADRKLRAFLSKQDPRAERRAELLDRLAAIVFVVFVIVLAAFFLALSQGYIG